VIDVHSLHLAGSGVRPAGADIDVTSRITSAPGSGSPETRPSTPLVERQGRCRSQATWLPALPLPAAVPVG